MSRVVITGGAGFIGSQLGHALSSRGQDVVLVDNMRYGHVDNLIIDGSPFGTFIGRDIRDARIGECFEGADSIFHFAGISALPVCQVDPREAYDVNTGGTAHVLEAARRAGVRRVVFSSTSAVYELNPTVPFSPDHVVPPDLVYSMTKFAAEAVCRAYASNYGMDVVICRFFNVYGPHQDFKRKSPPFTSYVARELAAGRRPVLFNQTEAKRDYIHVADVIALLLKVLEREGRYSADVFNVGTGLAYSVPYLYSEFERIAGVKIEPDYADPSTFWSRYPELSGGPHPLASSRVTKEVYKESVADISRTTSEFGWEPAIGIAEGLQSVYAYAMQHR